MLDVPAVILAAGKSERMGYPKPLLPFDKEENFLVHIINTLKAAAVSSIYVVLGAYVEEVKAILPEDVHIVINADYELGQLSSIQAAIKQLAATVQGLIITLVDHPFVKMETYKQLLSHIENEPNRIYVVKYKGRGGHPIYIPKRYFKQVLSAPLDVGLRYVVHNPKNSIFLVDTEDKGVIIDIDTPQEYETYVKRRG